MGQAREAFVIVILCESGEVTAKLQPSLFIFLIFELLVIGAGVSARGVVSARLHDGLFFCHDLLLFIALSFFSFGRFSFFSLGRFGYLSLRRFGEDDRLFLLLYGSLLHDHGTSELCEGLFAAESALFLSLSHSKALTRLLAVVVRVRVGRLLGARSRTFSLDHVHCLFAYVFRRRFTVHRFHKALQTRPLIYWFPTGRTARPVTPCQAQDVRRSY